VLRPVGLELRSIASAIAATAAGKGPGEDGLGRGSKELLIELRGCSSSRGMARSGPDKQGTTLRCGKQAHDGEATLKSTVVSDIAPSHVDSCSSILHSEPAKDEAHASSASPSRAWASAIRIAALVGPCGGGEKELEAGCTTGCPDCLRSSLSAPNTLDNLAICISKALTWKL